MGRIRCQGPVPGGGKKILCFSKKLFFLIQEISIFRVHLGKKQQFNLFSQNLSSTSFKILTHALPELGY